MQDLHRMQSPIFILLSILHGGEAVKLFLMIIVAFIVLLVLAGLVIYKIASTRSRSRDGSRDAPVAQADND